MTTYRVRFSDGSFKDGPSVHWLSAASRVDGNGAIWFGRTTGDDRQPDATLTDDERAEFNALNEECAANLAALRDSAPLTA